MSQQAPSPYPLPEGVGKAAEADQPVPQEGERWGRHWVSVYGRDAGDAETRLRAEEERHHQVLILVGGVSLPRVLFFAGQGRPAYKADAGQRRPAYKRWN